MNLSELKEQLRQLKEYHKEAWGLYGSELCPGDMLGKEKELEDLIKEYEKINK